jgi:hypothetical protein
VIDVPAVTARELRAWPPESGGRSSTSVYAHRIKVIGAQRYRDLDDVIAEARGTLECPQSAPSNG